MTSPDRSRRIPGLGALAQGAQARVAVDHGLLPATRIPFTTRMSLRFGLQLIEVEISEAARTELEAQLRGRDQLHIVAKTPCLQQRDLHAKRAEVRRAVVEAERGSSENC